MTFTFLNVIFPIKNILKSKSHKRKKKKASAYNKRRQSDIYNFVQSLTGKKPKNVELYMLATRHASAAPPKKEGARESYDRLEYLGDAVLGLVVAEYLFKKFPFKEEGFLTEIRSRIVSRESLNDLGEKLSLDSIVQFNLPNSKKNNPQNNGKSIAGDTLEAIVGAVYLDRGFKFCRKFILNKLIIPNFDLNNLLQSNPNHKSRIIEWAQKNNHDVQFKIMNEQESGNHQEFIAQVYLNNKPIASGKGSSKKKAEQEASRNSFSALSIEECDA